MLRGDNGLLLVLFVLRGDDGPVRGRLLLLWMDIGCFIFMGLLATEVLSVNLGRTPSCLLTVVVTGDLGRRVVMLGDGLYWTEGLGWEEGPALHIP